MPHHENLPPLNRQFVAHFGEMGSRWGINRTVGQIYALLFISAKPLNADEITKVLEFKDRMTGKSPARTTSATKEN